MEMQKFLFDRSFDTSRVIETNNKPEAEPTFEPEIPVPSYTEQDLNLGCDRKDAQADPYETSCEVDRQLPMLRELSGHAGRILFGSGRP